MNDDGRWFSEETDMPSDAGVIDSSMIRHEENTMMKRQQPRNVKLIGWGKKAGSRKLTFGDQTRYRMAEGETMLDLAETAAHKALAAAALDISDIDCIVCAMATPLQGIPCNAALVHEQIAPYTDVPAIDINTSCTSFLSAIDLMSYLVDAGRYQCMLILSGDTASAALNPKQKESYELFSDACTAFVLARTESASDGSAILYSAQKTWPEGAHDTEIRGGCGLLPAFAMTEENRDDYYFDMKGKRILRLSAKVLPPFVEECLKAAELSSGIKKNEIDLVVPHQASRALDFIMPRLGFADKARYIDRVSDYGNMVSASIPFVLCEAIETGRIRRGDSLLLLGTAAGLSANLVLLRF